ncbi:MAG TPA: hypothetical protein VGG03_18515 [Thermoanaerobaculia bacterium]
MSGGGTRQRNLLIVLGVLVVIAAWRYLGPVLGLTGGEDEDFAAPSAERTAGDVEDAGEPAPARPLSRRGRDEHHGARPGDQVSVLRMADLDRVPPTLVAGRDPWRFVDPPPPPPPAPPPPPSAEELRRQEEARRQAEEAARRAAEEAARLAAIPKPPDFTLEYLGNFGPPNRRIAVFTNGKKIYNLQEGETIENKFIVARIGYESVDIGFVGFPDTPAKRVGVRRR